jgi:hypothetical protein
VQSLRLLDIFLFFFFVFDDNRERRGVLGDCLFEGLFTSCQIIEQGIKLVGSKVSDVDAVRGHSVLSLCAHIIPKISDVVYRKDVKEMSTIDMPDKSFVFRYYSTRTFYT